MEGRGSSVLEYTINSKISLGAAGIRYIRRSSKTLSAENVAHR